MEHDIENLEWLDNSRNMYERVLEKTPAPFRKMTNNRLMERLSKRLGESKTVTESLFVDAVRETIPPPFTNKSVEAINKMRTGSQP